MGILDIFKRKPKAETRAISYEQMIATGLVGKPSLAGVPVSEHSALTISAFNRACKVKAQCVAGLPFKVYSKTSTGRDDADDHSLYSIIHDEPNPEQSAVEFWTLLEFWSTLYGNAYAEIERDNASNVVALWPILSPNVKVGRFADGSLAYQVQTGANEVTLPAANVLHLKGPGLDGSTGARLVHLATESLGLTIGMERAAGAFVGNAGRPSLIFNTESQMDEEQRAKLRQAYQTLWAGTDKAGAMMLLTGGLTAQVVEPTADFLNGLNEARRWQCEEICRWVGIDPIFIYSYDRATWNNAVQQRLNFLAFSLDPDLRQIESEVNRKCFRKDERGTYYAEFVRQSIVRLDPLTQHQVWQIGIQNGVYCPNECRAHMNLPPYEGGDEFKQLSTLIPEAEQPNEDPSTEDENGNTSDTNAANK